MKIRDRDLVNHKHDRDCLYFKADGFVFCLTPWDADFGCYRWFQQKWMPADRLPTLRLLFTPQRFRQPCQIRQRFLDRIPKEVQELGKPFRYLQLTMLRLMRLTPYAIDLARSNPVLLWFIAEQVSMGVMTFKKCRELLHLKEEQIVKQLWPYNQSLSAKLLKRIEMVYHDYDEFCVLPKIVNDTTTTSNLRYCGTMNLRDIPSQKPDWEILGCAFFTRFIRKVKDDAQYGVMTEIIRSSIDLAFTLGIKKPLQALERCSSYEQMKQLHDKWLVSDECLSFAEYLGVENPRQLLEECSSLEQLRQLHDNLQEKAPFAHYVKNNVSINLNLASPIVPGTKSIVPITRTKELYEEHIHSGFIGDYDYGASPESLSFYKVLWPERGTIVLMEKNGRLEVLKFKLHQNNNPSELSWDMVIAWFEDVTLKSEQPELDENGICPNQ